MSKNYLLLRNNRQSGPYDLQELLQQDLKPFDLVFIDGKSFGWSYPTEIDSLSPYLSFSKDINEIKAVPDKPEKFTHPQIGSIHNTSNAKHVFVSMPVTREQPSEKRDHVDHYNKQVSKPDPKPVVIETTIQRLTAEPELETNYSKTLDDIGEDYSSWLYNKHGEKKKKLSSKQVATAAVILIIVAGGLWAASSIMNSDGNSNTNKETARTVGKTEALLPTGHENEESIDEGGTIPPVEIENTGKGRPERVIRKSKPIPKSQDQHTAVVEKPYTTENTSLQRAEREPEINEGEVKTEKPKKQSLGDAIEKFFDKLEGNKEEGGTIEEDKRNKTTASGGRESSRRGDPEEESSASIVKEIDLSSDAPADNWMTGIQGVNITLKNQSNKAIKVATVEVHYYDEKNNLLTSKQIYYKNIPRSSGQTLPVPVHRSADHIDYKLVSVEVKENKLLKSF